ncbi:MAG: hypothetical protein NC408_04950 [Candidatus Gastranaerophilales bacterium]|nr:hypothetical protein [Candidatus Gastranaerophilales bacterium]
MKKLFILFFAFFFACTVHAEVLEAGVSIEEVPKALYGGWRITAHLDTTNAHSSFKPQSLDFWTLSRVGDSITLDNPYSGANTTISVKTVEGNLVVFSKQTPYDNNKVLTDIVTIRLNEDSFTGINDLKLETFSLIDKHLMKTETAKYVIKGEKISGDSILP